MDLEGQTHNAKDIAGNHLRLLKQNRPGLVITILSQALDIYHDLINVSQRDPTCLLHSRFTRPDGLGVKSLKSIFRSWALLKLCWSTRVIKPGWISAPMRFTPTQPHELSVSKGRSVLPVRTHLITRHSLYIQAADYGRWKAAPEPTGEG